MDEPERSGISSIQRKIREMSRPEAGAGSGYSILTRHPPFAYTVGFMRTFGHPEIVVAGLPEETSGGVLGAVYGALDEGVTYGDGDVSDGILEGLSTCFQSVSLELVNSNLVQALNFYGDPSPNALQLLWPDRQGKFPGEDGAPSWLDARQSLGV